MALVSAFKRILDSKYRKAYLDDLSDASSGNIALIILTALSAYATSSFTTESQRALAASKRLKGHALGAGGVIGAVVTLITGGITLLSLVSAVTGEYPSIESVLAPHLEKIAAGKNGESLPFEGMASKKINNQRLYELTFQMIGESLFEAIDVMKLETGT